MKNTRITVEIVRSTAKAHLVKDATGRETWIQAKWLREDNTVGAATFERGASAKSERDEAAAAARAFREASHPVRIARETEKAIAAEVVLCTPGGFETPTLVWFPKSRCAVSEGIASIPGWMIQQREEEAAANWEPRGLSSYERHRMAKGESAFLSRGIVIESAGLA